MRLESISKPAPAIKPGQIMLFMNMTWDGYLAIGESLRNRSAFRITFDRGNLEIMTTSSRHEIVKYLIGRIVDEICDTAKIVYTPGGSFTMQRPDLARALEADQSYYTKRRAEVAGKLEIDLAIDPPPDLCIEIDVKNRSIKRLPIYAQICVPEVWRWENGSITVYSLQSNGEYASGTTSTRLLKGLDLAVIAKFVDVGVTKDVSTMAKAVRRYMKTWLAKRKK